jgi:two-component system sensor histidine kinase RegB
MEWLTHSQTGFRQAARYLLAMRLALVTLLLIAVAVAETTVTLAHRAEALILCLVYAVLATLAWLWFTRRPPHSALTVSLTLTADLLLVGLWLFLTGGYTNPLVSLLLIPVAVAIILVPLGQGIAITIAGILVYTALMLWHTPVTREHHGTDLAQLHLIGMWVTFAMTAGILLLVVGTLARQLRQQQAKLAQVRESRLRDEQIIALGLSAASVAHRLGTPLNTLTLLTEELKSAMGAGEDCTEDLNLMDQQLALCSSHLQQLSSAATEARTARLETLAASDWMTRLKESATLLWPGARIEWHSATIQSQVDVDATLDQAVLNLLANAVTASPERVSVGLQQEKPGRVQLTVEDHGNGLDLSGLGAPGEQPVPSENGLGVGLFLTNATIQRMGGTLRARTDGHGTTMIIDLPEHTAPEPETGDGR